MKLLNNIMFIALIVCVILGISFSNIQDNETNVGYIGSIDSIGLKVMDQNYGNNKKLVLLDSNINRPHNDVRVNSYDDISNMSKESSGPTHADKLIDLIRSYLPNQSIDLFVVADNKGNVYNGAVIKALKEIDESNNVFDVINMSFCTRKDKRITKSLTRLYEKGIILIAAVGNDGEATMGYPACLESVISIGGVTKTGEIDISSNYGDLDFVMPTTLYDYTNSCQSMGTSISAMLFSIFTIEVMEKNAELSANRVIKYLRNCAVNPNQDELLGYGQPCFR